MRDETRNNLPDGLVEGRERAPRRYGVHLSKLSHDVIAIVLGTLVSSALLFLATKLLGIAAMRVPLWSAAPLVIITAAVIVWQRRVATTLRDKLHAAETALRAERDTFRNELQAERAKVAAPATQSPLTDEERRVIEHFAKADGRAKADEVARALKLTGIRATHVLDGLVERGLLADAMSMTRGTSYYVTSKGRAYLVANGLS